MKTNTAIVICAAIIVCAFILGGAYKYKYKEQNTIVVTGLGEEEFVSDLIVWRGWIVVDNPSITDGYAQLEVNKRKVQDFIMQKGIAPDDIVFMFVDSYKNTEPIYQNGNYVGQRFTGYTLRQQFTVESTDWKRWRTYRARYPLCWHKAYSSSPLSLIIITVSWMT